MKTITTTILIITLLIAVNSGAQGKSDKKPPQVDLHLAALQGNLVAIQKHIQAGSDLNGKDAYGSTPLIISATFGKAEAAKAMIEAGADVGITNKDGSTPLHIAAFFCRTEIVKALLNKGADKYLKNIAGSTALDIVTAPFDDDKAIYDQIGAALGPLGLVLDYEHIQKTRPIIAEMLK